MELIIMRSLKNTSTLIRAYSNIGLCGPLRNVRCLCQFNDTRWTSGLYDDKNSRPPLPSYNFPISSGFCRNLRNHGFINKHIYSVHYSTDFKDRCKPMKKMTEELNKLSIFQKMKQLTKDYWHILIPVHIVTSIGWVTMCYIGAKNGVDVIAVMEWLHLNEKYINIIKNSNAGNWAVTYALYKIITPLRYTVTVGGTTLAIRYLDRLGIMKFRRSTEKIRKKFTRQHVRTVPASQTRKTKTRLKITGLIKKTHHKRLHIPLKIRAKIVNQKKV